jgi:hypothetical protein
MVESPRDSENGVGRRAVLRGVASAGLAGTALTGTASAGGRKSEGGEEKQQVTFRAASGGTFNFQLVVTGRVGTDGAGSVVAGRDVQVAGSVAQGTVADGERRRFTFTGEIALLQISGPGAVLVDGEVVRDTTPGASSPGGSSDSPGNSGDSPGNSGDAPGQSGDSPGNSGDGEDDGEKRLPKLVVVTSPGVESQTDYVFEVTGEVEYLDDGEDSGNADDEVIDAGDRTRVEGTIAYADDRFAFSGELIPVEKPPEVNFDISER